MTSHPPPKRVGAVLLAAGFGTRLAPLTDATPKPLLEVGGRPVASHLMDLLDGIDPAMPVVVATNGCHGDQWRRWAEPLGDRLVMRANGAVKVDERAGAVADLAAAVDVLPPVANVLVIAGDNLLSESLAPHLVAAETSTGDMVLCRDLGADVPPGRHGEVTVDDDSRVVGFREKPDDPRSPLVATCTYVLDGTDLAATLTEYLAMGDPDSPGQFIGWLAEKRPVFARTITGSYFDIGNHETLTAARTAFGG